MFTLWCFSKTILTYFRVSSCSVCVCVCVSVCVCAGSCGCERTKPDPPVLFTKWWTSNSTKRWKWRGYFGGEIGEAGIWMSTLCACVRVSVLVSVDIYFTLSCTESFQKLPNYAELLASQIWKINDDCPIWVTSGCGLMTRTTCNVLQEAFYNFIIRSGKGDHRQSMWINDAFRKRSDFPCTGSYCRSTCRQTLIRDVSISEISNGGCVQFIPETEPSCLLEPLISCTGWCTPPLHDMRPDVFWTLRNKGESWQRHTGMKKMCCLHLCWLLAPFRPCRVWRCSQREHEVDIGPGVEAHFTVSDRKSWEGELKRLPSNLRPTDTLSISLVTSLHSCIAGAA